MLVNGIQAAQERTWKDFTEGRIWTPRHLAVPHLPYIVKHIYPHETETGRFIGDMDSTGCELADAVRKEVGLKCTHVESYPGIIVESVSDSFWDEIIIEPDYAVIAHSGGRDGMYIEDMPIKVPGGPVTIPDVVYFNNFHHVLDRCFSQEFNFNPCMNDQYFYLTIEQSWVMPGAVQRIPGVHLDGFQKPSIVPQVAQHQLAITNKLPTEFFGHAFDVDRLPSDKKGLFAALTEQSEGMRPYKPLPYELHLLNAFCPHRPSVATKRCFRTFIRFSASTIPFMRKGNTKNPLLPLEWNEDKKREFYASIAR